MLRLSLKGLHLRVKKLEETAETMAFWRREITAARDAVRAARTNLPEEAAELDGQTAGQAMAPDVGALREEIRKLSENSPEARGDFIQRWGEELRRMRDERDDAVAQNRALLDRILELKCELRGPETSETPELSGALLRALFVCMREPALFHPNQKTEAGEWLVGRLLEMDLITLNKNRLPQITKRGRIVLRNQTRAITSPCGP